MKGRTHLTIGLGIGVVASVSQPPEMMPVILAASGVASLAPDLDGNNLLNKRVTKTAKQIKKSGVFVGGAIMVLSLVTFFLGLHLFPFVDEKWFTQQNKLLLFGAGAVLVGFSLKSQETLKNILMSILSLFLLYYAAKNELWWLVMFALYIGGAGWFAHRGPTHTIWALIYWWYMSHLLEVSTKVDGLAFTSTIAYLSHILGDMLTKKGVKFLNPLTGKVFRIRI
ncbi:metal-dependent hydrolase [Bacillus sp. REN16]|uniref:metal-dependent hydrolase n=1 Tax=Bacillus sp. REN16 TaxID=2887296 RepID=UPI001E5DB889|nr:metal-dependent hydrolase [Bacillus sp. REN16]MCC3359439.1 metal-dependent hydrolase [Bacillus sp. REN16]